MCISILVLTLNEEANLAGCLDSVQWSDDIVVLDSFSVDNTVGIAKGRGARVVQRTFDDWASHQNYALENIDFKYEWVFYLDADERMTEDLKREILKIAAGGSSAVAYYCGRKNMFMGRWIKHAMRPGALMRFFKPPHVRFERLVNPTAQVQGAHGYLRNYLVHYNFSKGISAWVDKHNKYSDMEAIEGLLLLKGPRLGVGRLFDRDRVRRRRALKEVSFRLPARSLLKFCYLFFIQRGFLDGYPGFVYCVLQSIYEYLIVLKMKERTLMDSGICM